MWSCDDDMASRRTNRVAFLSLIEESSDPEAFISLGDELHDRTQPPDRRCALACYERAAALDPSDAEAWTSAAHVLSGLKRFEEAAASLARAIEMEPADADLWHFHGTALLAAGDCGEAAASYARCVVLLQAEASDDDSNVERLADAHVSCGNALHRTAPRGSELALAEYEAALTLLPGHAAATFNREDLLAKGYWEAAAARHCARCGSSACSPTTEAQQVLQQVLTETLPRRRGFAANPLHAVHVIGALLDGGECGKLVAAAEAHGGWGRARHKEAATVDIEASRVPVLNEWVAGALHRTLLPSLAQLYGIAAHRLVAREVFVVRYDAAPGGQRSLPLHRDGYAFSFNILLSGEFEGGGTRFPTLGLAVRPKVGECLMHCGQMMHGAHAVTSGVRYILVGFVDVSGPSLRELVAEEQQQEEQEQEHEEEEEEKEKEKEAAVDGAQEAARQRKFDYVTLSRYWAAATVCHLPPAPPATPAPVVLV